MKSNRLIAAVVAACVIDASACTAKDAWAGPDKVKHFAVGVAVGSAGTLAFQDPHTGFLIGVAVGAAKEFYDSQGHGTCSLQDFAVTALGAAAGAYGTAWIVTPRFVGYARSF